MLTSLFIPKSLENAFRSNQQSLFKIQDHKPGTLVSLSFLFSKKKENQENLMTITKIAFDIFL
jgi:hypothetical protein